MIDQYKHFTEKHALGNKRMARYFVSDGHMITDDEDLKGAFVLGYGGVQTSAIHAPLSTLCLRKRFFLFFCFFRKTSMPFKGQNHGSL